MMISGATQNEEEFNSAAASAKSTLQSFQIKMFDLEDLFIDAESTEFLIVTVLIEGLYLDGFLYYLMELRAE